MAVNWNEGLMRWAPHVDDSGRAYPLTHLHPFRYQLSIGESETVDIRVAFAMHCFTRAVAPGDAPSQLYRDEREIRTFCPDRYALSPRLPDIIRALPTRKCEFARQENYVTIDLAPAGGVAARYGVFFNVMRKKDPDGPAVLLTVQSAYPLDPGTPDPGHGAVRFTRLIELTLEGIKPRPPKRR